MARRSQVREPHLQWQERVPQNYAPLPRWLRLEKKLQSQLKFPGSTGGVVDRAE
jgi:hypothetical protein